MEKKIFYIYLLRRPDKPDPFNPDLACPFYVGKGKNGREDHHKYEAKYTFKKPGRKTIKNSIIHKLWKAGFDYQEEIPIDKLEEWEAFIFEKQIISEYGRIDKGTGCLANMTDGGEGVSGITKEESLRRGRAISKAKIGMIFTKEHKQALKAAWTDENRKRLIRFQTNRERPEEELQRMRKNRRKTCPVIQWVEKKYKIKKVRKIHKHKGIYQLSEEIKQKISIANLGKTRSEEIKQKMRVIWAENPNRGMKGRKHSPETKQKMRENLNRGMRGKIHTEEAKEKMRKAKIGHIVSEETRRKRSETCAKKRLVT